MNLLSAIERLNIKEKIVNDKVRNIVPKLMHEHDIEMWIVSGSDYQMKTLLPEPTNNNTTLIFLNKDGEYKSYQNVRHMHPGNPLYTSFLEQGETVAAAIERFIKEKNPKNIAINISREFHELNGGAQSLYEDLKSYCDIPIVSAELLAMDVSQTRTEDEIKLYHDAAFFAKEIIKRAMSAEIITPGVTTTTDVRAFMLQQYSDNGLVRTWGPNVDMQRAGSDVMMIGMGDKTEVIEKGDLLHIDFGFEYVDLHTDMQYLCYIRKDGEEKAPKSLVDGFNKLHDFQKMYMDVVKAGKTGNEARAELIQRAEDAGLEAMVYSHPIGHSVHSVGPSIGRFGAPGDIPHGKYTIKDNTCFAMEQNIRVTVPEWNDQKVWIFREEDIIVQNGEVLVLGALQEELYIV